MFKMKRLLEDDNGAVILLVAIAGAVLLGMAGLAVDVGLAYLQDARLQNAVDAAALAGARELPVDPQAAEATALAYAQANGLQAGEVTAAVENNNTALRVTADREVHYFFAPAVGQMGASVQSAALAQVEALGAAEGVVPIGVPEQELHFGQEYVLKEGGGEDTELGSGNYGILDLDDYPHWYEDLLENGTDRLITVGDVLLTATGVHSGNTIDGINARLARCTNPLCTPDNFEPGCPRVLLVPVYRTLGDSNQVKEIQIVGFAAFYVETVEGMGNENEIRGYFVRTVVSGRVDPDLAGYGLYGVTLRE